MTQTLRFDIALLTSRQIRSLTTDELRNVDAELARRAIALGQPGSRTRTHRMILNTLANR
jgi:hypothetical protein